MRESTSATLGPSHVAQSGEQSQYPSACVGSTGDGDATHALPAHLASTSAAPPSLAQASAAHESLPAAPVLEHWSTLHASQLPATWPQPACMRHRTVWPAGQLPLAMSPVGPWGSDCQHARFAGS